VSHIVEVLVRCRRSPWLLVLMDDSQECNECSYWSYRVWIFPPFGPKICPDCMDEHDERLENYW
jgi:hypothetical protein